MTNLEAIRNDIIYPLEDGKLEKALLDRGVDPAEGYSLLTKKVIELVRADLYVKLITAPNLTEAGTTINVTEKTSIMKIASATYLKNGEADPFAVAGPIVTEVSCW